MRLTWAPWVFVKSAHHRGCPGSHSSVWRWSVGGRRRWDGVRVEIIPRRRCEAFPSFLKAHSTPLRRTMKCLGFTKTFLNWVSGALLGPLLDTQILRKCVLPHSVWEWVMWRYLTLFFAKSLCMKQTEIQNSQPVSICEWASSFNLTPFVTI